MHQHLLLKVPPDKADLGVKNMKQLFLTESEPSLTNNQQLTTYNYSLLLSQNKEREIVELIRFSLKFHD